MIAVHFRNDERDVRLHPEILGVAEDEFSSGRECGFHLESNHRVERGKYYWRAYYSRIARNHASVLYRRRRRGAVEPPRDLTVLVPRGPLRRRELGDLKPRMVCEQANEHLP